MRVHGQRDDRARVAEALRDDVHRDTSGQKDRRVRVPQVMKPDRRRRRGAELPGAAPQRVGERPGEMLRLQVPPLVVGEDQGVIPGQLQRHRAACLAVGPQHGHRRRVEVDDARLAALGVALR